MNSHVVFKDDSGRLRISLLGDVSEAIKPVNLPRGLDYGAVLLILLAVSMLVVVDPLAFILGAVRRGFVGAVSVTDVLIPISVVL